MRSTPHHSRRRTLQLAAILVILAVSGVSFLMFSDVPPARQPIHKALDNAQFLP